MLNEVGIVRPPVVVHHTFNYIRDCICDQDQHGPNQSYFKYATTDQTQHTFLDIYVFVHDRLRQLVKDLTIVDDCLLDIDYVRACEQMCRFLILSYHDGYFYEGKGFSIV